jgi:hypothetical protein
MQQENIIARDGGYASRKLLFALFTSVLILISPLIIPTVTLGEVISGLVAVAGVYITGNVVTKWRAAGVETARLALQKPEPKPEVKPAVKAEDLSD